MLSHVTVVIAGRRGTSRGDPHRRCLKSLITMLWDRWLFQLANECALGELELASKWVFDLKIDSKSDPRVNRRGRLF